MKRFRISHPKRIASGITLFLLLSYVASYFLIQELPPTWRLPQWATLPTRTIPMKFVEVNGEWEVFPDYHGLPDALFAPLHQLDRDHLRPGKWSGKYPPNTEIDFDWLLGQFAENSKGPSKVQSMSVLH